MSLTRSVSLAALILTTAGASAEIAYALRERENFRTDLVMFDTAGFAAASIVGFTGVDGTRLAGLAHTRSGLFAYGENRTVADGQGGLYRIDQNTGAATWIGGSDLNGWVVRDLAYNPADGQLYGLAVVTGNNSNYAHMVTIDTDTGLVTSRREIWGTVNIQMTALAIGADGSIFGVDNVQDALWSMSLNNLNRYDAVRVGTGLGGFSISADQGFAISALTGEAVLAANGPTNGFNNFRLVDLDNGTSTVLGQLPNNPFGTLTDITDLTFIIPAPGTLGALAAAGLALTARRRRIG